MASFREQIGATIYRIGGPAVLSLALLIGGAGCRVETTDVKNPDGSVTRVGKIGFGGGDSGNKAEEGKKDEKTPAADAGAEKTAPADVANLNKEFPTDGVEAVAGREVKNGAATVVEVVKHKDSGFVQLKVCEDARLELDPKTLEVSATSRDGKKSYGTFALEPGETLWGINIGNKKVTVAEGAVAYGNTLQKVNIVGSSSDLIIAYDNGGKDAPARLTDSRGGGVYTLFDIKNKGNTKLQFADYLFLSEREPKVIGAEGGRRTFILNQSVKVQTSPPSGKGPVRTYYKARQEGFATVTGGTGYSVEVTTQKDGTDHSAEIGTPLAVVGQRNLETLNKELNPPRKVR